MEIDKLTEEEIVKGIEEGIITRDDFLDSKICATCFDRNHNHILYGDDSSRTIYEDEDLIGMLVSNPRSIGHSIIVTKKHYNDMLQLDDEICKKVYCTAKKLMNVLKEVYECEAVYLCTMCDGKTNHFHVQLIPRYQYEKRGSKNFVKERKEYIVDKEKINKIRKKMI